MLSNYDQIQDRARELCQRAGLDPDFLNYEGQDDLGYAIREPNWTLFVDEATAELGLEE